MDGYKFCSDPAELQAYEVAIIREKLTEIRRFITGVVAPHTALQPKGRWIKHLNTQLSSVESTLDVSAAGRQGLPGRLRQQPLLGARTQGPTASTGGDPGHEVAGHAHSTIANADEQTLLATHLRAVGRGARVVEEAHWDGLPTGKGRRTTTGDVLPRPRREPSRGEEAGLCRPW